MRIVAIIPARDEADTVADVVRAVVNHSDIARVIVANSCSVDDTPRIAQEAGAHVVHASTFGKGEAMQCGVLHVKDATHFLFLDADLVGLKPKHVTQLVSKLDHADMVIGIQDRGSFINFFTRRMLLKLSGQRIVPRAVWDDTPKEFKSGYRVELALNYTARKMRLKIRAYTLKGVTAVIQEFKRSGIFRAFVGRFVLIRDVISAWIALNALYKARDEFTTQEEVRT